MVTPRVTYRGRQQVLPDHELTARFAREVLPLRNQLHGKAIRLTRNQQDAEDLVQDTILNAYAGFRTFHEGTNAMAWLHRIMRNTWINHWRKKQRSCHEVSVGRVTDDVDPGDENLCSAEIAALRLQPDTEIKAALMALNAKFRLTVYYADVEGFSIKEIARIMEVPVGTVISRLHRGRRSLRASLLSVASQYGYSA
jgi:RNA polymerase sigma-70 factor (ECF subfamily)